MILWIKTYKWLFSLLALSLFFFLFGIIISAGEVELTGLLCIFTSIITLIYLLISGWFSKRKLKDQSLGQKEIWGASILISVLSVLGAIESYPDIEVIASLFTGPLVAVFVFNFINYRKTLNQQGETADIRKSATTKFTMRAFIFGLTLILFALIALELEFQALILSFFYFALLFVFAIRWLIRQMKLIIQLKNEKAKTELLHLKSQVNPHFFFNMLNNLYGLVEIDSVRAKELILKLSDMMRYSIYEGQKELVTLEEEAEYLKNFIELHQMRYHKKIDIQFNLDLQAEGSKVMPLLFIILLENAFKHGVENLRKNAYVHLSLTTTNHEIRFNIENNFDETELSEQPGIGLKNLKRRLELVYPNNHALSFSTTDEVYKAQLTINQL